MGAGCSDILSQSQAVEQKAALRLVLENQLRDRINFFQSQDARAMIKRHTEIIAEQNKLPGRISTQQKLELEK